MEGYPGAWRALHRLRFEKYTRSCSGAKVGDNPAGALEIAGGLMVRVGMKCPSFRLASSEGGSFDTKSDLGKTAVVLFFYPKADTPGCTIEACGFSDAITRYKTLKVPVYGVSPDPIKDVKAFATKFKLKIPLLADEDHAVCKKFGVWVKKSMYGKQYMGVARTTFIVGKDGKIAHIFEKVDPKAEHDQEVLAWIDENLI